MVTAIKAVDYKSLSESRQPAHLGKWPTLENASFDVNDGAVRIVGIIVAVEGFTMRVNSAEFIRSARRLREATGYLELGMAQHSLDCLEGLGDLGPFEAAADLIRGEALRLQCRYDAARESLEAAARRFPAPHDRPAWLALSRVYRQTGQMTEAIDTLARARGAQLPGPSPQTQ